jgi:anaerobic ribonucleoside-triphosphate reductase activating protein
MASQTIRLGHGLDRIRASLHNGPGWRGSIWLQGCRLRCTEICLNPHLLNPRGGQVVAVQAVVEQLRALSDTWCHPVEGVTILGGEPSEQPDALAALLQGAQSFGLTTMVYTGRTHEQLAATEVDWLRHTDLLVDGPFVDAEYDEALPWRGSRNQRLLCLSPAYTESRLLSAWRKQRKAWSLLVTRDGGLSLSGLQKRTTMRVAAGTVVLGGDELWRPPSQGRQSTTR